MKKSSIVLVAFFFSGLSALTYEVIWTRALSLVLGSTTYALSTMLSTFMAGLAIGGALGGRLADRRNDLLKLFGLCEAGIGIFALLTVPLIYALPPVYLSVYRAFHPSFPVFLGIQFLLCGVIMLAPTTLMGVTFPLVARTLTQDMTEMGRKVGNAYAVNTLGAIIGAFAAGFLLIPSLGIKTTTFVAAGINLGVAVAVLYFLADTGKKLIPLISAFFLLAGGAAAYSAEKTTFITFYTASRFPQDLPVKYLLEEKKAGFQLLYYREHPQGSVRLYRDRDGYLLLQTGGRIEGTARGDMANTLLLAYLPIASHRGPENFLVVGLGAGVTLMAAKQQVREVDVVEINPGVVEALKLHGPQGLFDGVTAHIDDAREYLSLTDKQYDVISSEPSYPAETSIANLFTREYYVMAKGRLRPRGVYCQWLPYYFLRNIDVTMMLKTFGSVFEHVYLWKVGQTRDLLMIGSEEPFPFDSGEIIERVKALNTTDVPLEPTLSREPRQVTDIVNTADVPVNTDDRPFLEFNTVRNIISGIH